MLKGTGGAARNEIPPCADDCDRVPWLMTHGTVVLTALWPTLSGDPVEGGAGAVVTIVGGAWRRRQQLDEVNVRFTGQEARPGEGCGQRRRVEADLMEDAVAVGETRGRGDRDGDRGR